METNKPTGKQILKETLSAQASNPGGLRLNPLRWASTNPGPFVKQVVGLTAGYLLMTKVHWIFALVLLGFLAWTALYWFNIRTQFKIGDVNPGKVIHLNPDRIAVATDFTKLMGSFPILKIVELNLLEQDKVLNKIIPTIAGYTNNPHGYPFWSEFHPAPINHGVSNQQLVDSYMNTFTESDIKLIDERLQKIGNINVPNTYRIDIEQSDWRDYKNLKVGKLSKLMGPDAIKKLNLERPNLELKPTQIWDYETREIEKSSTVQIVKIDKTPNGEIIHINIKDVHFKRDINTPSKIHHIPMDANAFRNSVTRLSGIKKVSPEYEEGYNQWKQAFDAGKGGIFTISIAQIVESLDQIVPT